MPLKDRIQFLSTPEQVDGYLRENPRAAIFKAGTCHKTSEMFANVDAELGSREDFPFAVIRVVEARGASDRVSEITGIAHESPQLLLFSDGRAVYDRDNWDISAESIAEALEEHFTQAQGSSPREV
jgi:bacillithiol system protein YtxJ